MVNLFRQLPAAQGSLTAALLALLEHSDRDLLNGLLRQAGLPAQVPGSAELGVEFPAPDGPPAAGRLEAPDLRLTVLTQAPGEALPSPGDAAAGDVLAVTLTGRAPEGVHSLSWEQVDRWLAGAAERYDAESRTGFLIRQFRALLPEMGIEYFPGFETEQLAAAPGALRAFGQFLQTAGQFFERLAPALGAAREGLAQVRQSRAEDSLAGYIYRDYTAPAFTPAGFLRVALHLPQSELQTSLWLAPGPAHTRLREVLSEDDRFLEGLRQLEQDPLLWLWSAQDERKLPLDEFRPEALAELTWAQYQAGVQRSVPLDSLAGPGSVDRTTELAEQLLAVLSPVLVAVLH